MGSLAVSRLASDETLPSVPIADKVAEIARKELAPHALAIDEGTLYPDALLRKLGEAGAWGSHQPENGAADLRCAIQSIASIGEVCGAFRQLHRRGEMRVGQLEFRAVLRGTF